MHPFWNTKLGRLLIGGCGAQIGLLFTLGGLTIVVLSCSLCLLANVVSLNLIQEPADGVAVVPAEASSSSTEIALLREKVNLLVSKVIFVRANAPAIPAPTPIPPPPPPKPIVLADQGAINLRSGPGDYYNKVGRLAKGESLEIVGRNSDSSWWLVITPEGYFAWVCSKVVSAYNLNNNLPIVSIPALLVQPAASGAPVAASGPGVVDPPASAAGASAAALALPAGTPTAPASASRRFVQDTLGYKQLIRRLLLPTVSESFSPDGAQIAITEKIKLYIITTEGANSRVLLEDDDKTDLVGGAVWSPEGKYLALVANRLQNCAPPSCRTVGLVRLGDGAVTWLQPPTGLGLDLPRWTQDGRLLVTAHAGNPAQGSVYVYDTSGQGQVAAGTFLLSSSHDGQKWFPWQPGKPWQVDSSGQVDSYYGD